MADSFFVFVLARAMGGISKANVSLATAVMADVTDATTRAKAMVTANLFIYPVKSVVDFFLVKTRLL